MAATHIEEMARKEADKAWDRHAKMGGDVEHCETAYGEAYHSAILRFNEEEPKPPLTMREIEIEKLREVLKDKSRDQVFNILTGALSSDLIDMLITRNRVLPKVR